ncbi:hypothetical protein JIQ42_07760 [Leishmania sp. Namibia]|uniref:hypothetical protein n=1 Tax=Leishmania sp. Namibia TaxID=2802991 RepID=UPI001B6994B7|nr:hypothetical protein JIQ42_07760 [Leishmania sp. Namibia]
MQLPQLMPALTGAAVVASRDAMVDPAVLYDESSSGYENADASLRLYQERNGDSGVYTAGYGGHQRRPSDVRDAPRRQSSLAGQPSVLELRASASPRVFPSSPVAVPVNCSFSSHVDGTAAGCSASVPLPPAYCDRLDNRMARSCSSHHGTDSSWCCGSSRAARADELDEKALPGDDGCCSGCCERFSRRRIGAALLSTTPQVAPGYLLALIGVVTGLLLFLPWSCNPVHITLMVLSGAVGCVCGLVYWAAERRWYRRWRHEYSNVSGATTVYCGVGGVPGWHGQPICGSAAPQYHVDDVDDVDDAGGSDETCCGSDTSCRCCCTTDCACHFIDRQHFRMVLPALQLLLLGAFVLVSPQVMATWTVTTGPTTGLGGGAILADSTAGGKTRYGATLYPVEVVWKCCLLHAWVGMGFSLPLLWSVLVGLVHMAVLLAQHQHAGPGTLLTLVVWMSVPLLCFVFMMCIAKPPPTLMEEQQQRQPLRVLSAGRRGVGYYANNRVGAGAPLPLLASLSFSRGRGVFRATHALMPHSGSSTVTPVAPARAAQCGAHPFLPVVLPPPPVAAYSQVSYAQTPSACGYARLVRGRGVRTEAVQCCPANDAGPCTGVTRGRESDARLVAPQHFAHAPHDVAAWPTAESARQGAPLSESELVAGAGVPPFNNPTSLSTSFDTPLPPPHGQVRDPSASMYSPSSPPHKTREMRCESAHDTINAVGGVRCSTTLAAALFPSSEDGAHPSLPPPPVSRQFAPPPRSPIVSMRADPAAVVNNLEPTPQPPPPRPQHRHAQQTPVGEAEEVRVLSDGAPAVIVSTAPSPQEPLPQRQLQSAATKERRAGGESAAAAAPAAGDEGRGNGADVFAASLHDRGYGGEESDSELLMSDGASLEDACAPYLVLDAALVIVDVSPPLCRLLGTTVDAVLFRRLPDVLAWLDVVEREAVVRLVSAVAQPLRIADPARGGQKRGTAACPARKESAKKGKRKKGCASGNHDHDDNAEDGVRDDDQYDNDKGRSAQAEAANQLKQPFDSEVLNGFAEGAPVRRVTLRGRCPYYVNGGGSTSDIGTRGVGRRPPFALCFDIWAERLAAPASKAAAASLRKRKSRVAGGGPPSPAPFVVILRRPLVHGLCDALPLPLALVHPRTGEVLCWNRYAARLTGCAAYDMLGTSAYSGFLYEAPSGAAITASSHGASSSTGRPFAQPPPPPDVESMLPTHQQQRPPHTTALSAATAIGTVPGGEVASHADSALPVKSTAATTAALRHSSQQTTPPAFSPLHGGAGDPPFAGQKSLPPNVSDLSGTFTFAASQQHCAAPLPGFFYVPCARTAAAAAAAVANAELNSFSRGGGLATASACGGRGARQSSTSTIGGGSYRTSPPQLPWALAGRGGGESGSANNNGANGASVSARCLRPPPPPPPPSEGHLRGSSTHDEAAVATAFGADGHQKVRENDGEDDNGAMAPSCRYTAAAVRGLLFRATLRPLRGVLCTEEAGVIENQLGRPLRTSAVAVAGELAGGSAAVEEERSGEGRALVLEDANVVVDHHSGSDDGGEAVLSERHLERQQEQRRHRLGRSAASARIRNCAHEEDSDAEDESDMDDDDDIPFGEDDLPKEMSATVKGGLALAATLEQLFAAKSMLCNFGCDRELAAGPRRGSALAATTTATVASGALLNSELLPHYSLCEAIEQLAASEVPLLLTLSEPPVYATACASAESLLQERWLSHRRVGSVVPGERGYSGALTHANNGGAVMAISGSDYANVRERRLCQSPPPSSSSLARQRPQVPALWGDGSASLQFVASVKEAVESYRESIEEDASGYTDLLGLLSLSGGSGCVAHNSSSSRAPAPFSYAPDAAVKAAITPDAVRQLRLLKSLSDQLLQATAAYNRTRQSMRSTTRRLSGGGVAGRLSPSSSSPSFSFGLSGAPAAPDADRCLNAHHPRSATTPLLCKDPPTSGSLRVSAHPSPFQPPPPPQNPSSTGETSKGAHRRQEGGNPRRRNPGEPPASASTGGSGGQTRIYRDPNGMSPSAASKKVTAAAASGVGNSTSKEPPPPNRGGTSSFAAAGGTGESIGAQNADGPSAKSRPRHAAKSSKTSGPPNASGSSHAGARHSGQGRTTAATPVTASPLNRSSSAVAAGPLTAMATPRQHAAGAGGSALDMATPQTELNSPSPRLDTILAGGGEASGRGDVTSEDAAGAVGVANRSATSPRFQGSRLLSPSLAAAEVVEMEVSYSTDPRQPRPQHRGSPNSKSGAVSGNAATTAKREQASPRRRSSAAYKRESSLDVLPGASAGSGSFCGNAELIPTSNTVSPPAGAGGHATSSSSPHPARPGSSTLNANATAAAAATAAVRSTPRRLGEGAVWAVLVSRDEATIPSCCISSNLGEEFRLGRSSKCTAVVSDSFVSSTQFSIVRSVSASTTQDLQSPNSGRCERGARRGKAFTVTLYDRSANGTYVNVKKLGKDKSCVLRDKALITFRLSTSQFFLGFVFILTDERGVPLDDRTGMGCGSALRSLLDARLSPRPLTGRRNNVSTAGGCPRESGSGPNTVVASPTSIGASVARRNTPRALSTPDNSSFASATPNGSRRAGVGAPRSGRHAHRETIEWKIGEEMLGKGGNAEVYLGINLTNGQLIAVKRVRLPTCAHGSDAEQDPEAKAILQQYRSLQEEINVLSRATHPNIVQYYGSSQNSTYFNILLEFVPGGSLRHLLDNFGALSPGVILSYLHQALEGLAYLHRHNIVHSDFKAANILITEKGKVKLTDFGTARLLNRPHATAAAAAAARGGGDAHSGTSCATSGQRNDDAVSLGAGGTLHVAGTLRWMDPALFHNARSVGGTADTAAGGAKDLSGRPGGPTKAGDIWSVGCTMIEMMSGEAPWFEYDFESEEQIVNLLTYTAEPPEIPECPECPDLVTVAQTCLKLDASQRPTCEALLRIVEEAMSRLQAQSMSPSASPSREVSQQQSAVPGSVSGGGATVRSSSGAVDPPMELAAGTAFVPLTAKPAAAHVSALDDRCRAERVGRLSDATPVSLIMGVDEAGSSAPASAFGAAASTAC